LNIDYSLKFKTNYVIHILKSITKVSQT